MNNTVSSGLVSSYVSSVDFLADRDIYDKLFDRYSQNDSSLINFMELTGREESLDSETFHHFEKDWLYQAITVANVAGTPGIGNDVTITLDAANHDQGRSIPKVTDLILFSNEITGYVIAKDTTNPVAHTITVRAVDFANDDVVSSVAVSDSLSIYSNAHAEGSNQPEGLVSRPFRFQGQPQIFKGHYDSTGSAATNRIEISTSNGKRYWMFEGENECFLRFRSDMSFGLLFNQESDGLTDSQGRDIRVTKGALQWIREEGNVYNSGVSSLTDIDNIIKILDRERGSKENLWLAGINQDIAIDNVLMDKHVNGAIVYNTFGKGNAKEKAIDMGFKSFTKSNYTFHKQCFTPYNHPQVTSVSGYTYPDQGLILPTDTGRDVRSGKKMHSICYRYKAAPHMNRKYIHKVLGMLAPNPTNDVDEISFEYLAEGGLQMFGLNRFMIIK